MTLEDDLEYLRSFVRLNSAYAQAESRLDRVSAALRDRAHLEAGARIIMGMLMAQRLTGGSRLSAPGGNEHDTKNNPITNRTLLKNQAR